MSNNYWLQSNVSALYASYRPSYPIEIFEKLVAFAKQGSLQIDDSSVCVDVGCGNGQATRTLAKYFKHVIGVDPSPSQIEYATGLEKDELQKHADHVKIDYHCAGAENIPVPALSATVVTAAAVR